MPATAFSPPAGAYAIDGAHSSAEFAVKHLMISIVTGRIKGIAGALHLDPARPEQSRVEASLDVGTIDTADEKRDAHLRSPDFFDAANHPRITFRSVRAQATGKDEGQLVGELTIRGVTKQVPLKVAFDGAAKDPWGGTRVGFTAEATLDRKDFGLHWNMLLETGGVLVGDKVKVTLRVEAVHQPA
ncbi:MAG: YceI family protein [Halobacteriales archaeon]|nr:YceI family protein [Halobacteriales archaeon]